MLLISFSFQVDLVKKTFQAQREFLVKASSTKMPPKVRKFLNEFTLKFTKIQWLVLIELSFNRT